MTQEEFNKTSFGKGDAIIYKGITYPLSEVDFEEQLFGINIFGDYNINWIRCENATFIPLSFNPLPMKSVVEIAEGSDKIMKYAHTNDYCPNNSLRY